MKITKIHIENYKGFLTEDIDFHNQLNVFIGNNASGKTSLLEAIVKGFYDLLAKFISMKRSSNIVYGKNPIFFLTENNINYSQDYCAIVIYLKDNLYYNNPVPITIGTGNLQKEINDNSPKRIRYNRYFHFFKNAIKKREKQIPIFKMYPTKRGNTDYLSTRFSSEQLVLPDYPKQILNWANIYQNNVSYSELTDWFFDKETEELRYQRDAGKFDIELPDLKFVRAAIKKAFQILEKKNYLLKSNKQNNTPTLSLQDQDNKEITEDLSQKSDGEKAIITLIADIAYNLSIAHNFENSDGNYLASPGIVLIDEIEAHLHPTWQRKIVGLLTEIFPNIQFFITTHSPQVIASVNSKSLFLCDNFKVSKINIKSKGTDSNTLLKYVFNATERPKPYVDLIEEFERLMEEEKAPKEVAIILTKIEALEQEDKGTDVSMLLTELNLQLEAYKFELDAED